MTDMAVPKAVNGSATPFKEFVLPLSGPALRWPREDAPQQEKWRLPRWHPDGDKLIRGIAATAVLTVAAIAAVVSYSHIFDLAYAHHEFGTAARLLPVSVDGLIASASLALLHAARKGISAPAIAYLMLWLGVGATVAANVGYGLPYGWLAAVIAAWPAVAFVGSVEMALTLARNQRRAPDDGLAKSRQWRLPRWLRRPVTGEEDGDAVAVPSAVTEAAAASPVQSATPVRANAPQRPRRLAKARSAADRVDAELTANPDRTNAEIAKAARASERTVERRRDAARKTSSTAKER
jgi:hypothetical protein